MNRKKIILQRANNWVNSHNLISNGKFYVTGFHIHDNGTEYLLLKSDYKTIYYGDIEIIESYLGLKFFGMTTINQKIALMFFWRDGEMFND